MKKKKILITTITILFLTCTYFFINSFMFEKKADTVIYGNIYTGVNDSKVDAVAIKDKKFIYVGNKDGVKNHMSKKTKVLKYDEGLILSGFTDTHTHITNAFASKEYQIDLTKAKTIDEYKEIMKKFVAENPDEKMYIGRGWNYMLFENGAPNKKIIDDIIPNVPVFIKSEDGHSAWVNSKFIELTGVTKDTENPSGGEIIRDESGEASGCFKDSAMDIFVKPNIIPYSIKQYKHLIELNQKYYASLGYTAYVEVFVDSDEVNYNLFKAYEELDKEGKLFLRVNAAWTISNNEKALDNVRKIIKYKNESKGGMFELTDIKIFMDGVAETKTAFLSEPYSNDLNNYGSDRWPGEESFERLVDLILLANKNDMAVHFHAIGDAAISKTLDVIEASRKKYINKNVHNVITHAEIIKENDIKRFKKLDVIVAANLSWGCMDDTIYSNVEVKNLGEERAFKAYPYKSLLDSKVHVSSATDYSASPVVNPIASYIIAVNRNATFDEKYTRDPSQKMTKYEALRSLTYEGAYQMGQENVRGTIEVGKNADLIVLDTNILKNSSISSIKTKILLSMVNGKIVYKNNK